MTEPVYVCCPCGMPMARRDDGAWSRGCACKSRRYWANLAPLHADAIAFRQLTGQGVPTTQAAFGLHYSQRGTLYRYGPP